MCDAHLEERLIEDPLLECFFIEYDIGQLGHGTVSVKKAVNANEMS
jgi:hypothetical protein